MASHILPWAQYPKYRLDRGNALCLVAHFDRAFDRGLIALDDHCRLPIGTRLRSFSENPAVKSESIIPEGRPLLLPENAKPSLAFLKQHRTELLDKSKYG